MIYRGIEGDDMKIILASSGLGLANEEIGGNIEFIDLQAHDLDYVERRIDVADMIFCFGGNTDYLANIFTKTGFNKLLPKILAEKVWVGSSAGSCALSNWQICMVYAVSDDCALKVVDGEVAAVLGTDYIVAKGGEQ